MCGSSRHEICSLRSIKNTRTQVAFKNGSKKMCLYHVAFKQWRYVQCLFPLGIPSLRKGMKLPSSTYNPLEPPTQLTKEKELFYKSDLVFSTPHGSSNKFVLPWLFSHVSLPVRGPALGTLAALASPALAFKALSRSTTVSGVKSS